MAINKRLLVKPPDTGITPSEHFGVVLYEGDGSSSHSINGGKFGAGAYFNGSSSQITTSNDIPLEGEFAISLWLRQDAADHSGNGAIFDFGYNSSPYMFAWIDNGTIRFDDNTAPTGRYYYSTATTSNAWNHIVITRNSSNTTSFYLNGSLDGTSSNFTQDVSHPFTIGYSPIRNGGAGDRLGGKVDQVRIFSKGLSSSEVSTLYAETASTVESLDPLSEDTTETLQVLGDSSCIATYRFENNEDDLSGNYDGTGVNVQYAAGRYGQAADFNGSSSNVELPTGSPFNDSDTIKSISAWVKADTTSSRVYPFSIGSTTTDNQFFNFGYLGDSNNILVFMRNGSNSNQAYHSASTTTDTNWHHIVVQTTGSAVEIYLDGESKSVSSTYAGSGSASSWISYINYTGTVRANIGTNASFDPQYSNGKIDQVRFFNKALSASEVTTLYNENSLVASYRFEGNANDDTKTYNGTASNVTYEYGLNFTPDFVWIKGRTSADNNFIFDTTRGDSVTVNTNLTAAEYADTGVTSFDTGGFTLGSGAGENRDGDDYVAWCLKANGGTTTSATTTEATNGTYQANVDSGFSIVTFTTSNSTVQPPPLNYCEHGLGVAPSIVIYKETNDSGPWQVNVPFISNNGALSLNLTNAMSSGFAYDFFDSDSTNIAIRSNYAISRNVSVVAYVFAEIEGFSKFGSYTGNGDANGPIVETGFEPAFVMVKGVSIGSNWNIHDNRRGGQLNDAYLFANTNNAEVVNSAGRISFLSNGFQISTSDVSRNSNGDTFIYMAFAADPDTEEPTVAKSFSTVAYSGNNSTQSIDGLGFQPNLIWIKGRDFGGWNVIQDSVRGAGKTIFTNVTNAEVGNSGDLISSFDSDGFSLTTAYLGGTNASTNGNFDYVAWAWKADDNEPTIYGGPAVAVYKFEDNANDVTGNNNGTVSGATYTTGKFNKAINFDGSGDYVTIPATDTTPLNFSSENFTISHWVYPHNTAESAIYSSKWSTGSANQRSYYFGHNASGNIIISENPGGSFTSTSTVTQNAWNHVVYVRNASTAYIYINGSLDSTHSRTNTIDLAGTQNIYFGRVQGTPSGDMYDGLMDQTRFYSGALSQEQVTELYNETVDDNDDLTLGGPPETIISASANSGFSIVKFTSPSTNTTGFKVPHGLSQAPDLILTKPLDAAVGWHVYSSVFSNPAQSYLRLETTDTLYTGNTNIWNNTAATSTVFSMKTGYAVGTSSETIAYCFHSIAGYSKIGSYSGTGSAGNAQNVGFTPDWLMVKRYVGAASQWVIIDSVRGTKALYADLSNAESSESRIFLNSTGFEFTGSAFNESSTEWIYMAFKIN